MQGLQPLIGLNVVEFDAIGPVPFCGMMLADHGAKITRVTRPGGQPNGIDIGADDILLRGRDKTLALDLKSDAGRQEVLDLLPGKDVLIEGHRPGVMERLGLGPDACHLANPALVYCRITGYGQDGPLSSHPGHDINYIAQTGALHAIGPAEAPPPPPLSLVGDFGGGGMMGAFAIMAAVYAARATQKGSVIDVAMVDGAALQMAMTYSWKNASIWSGERDDNILDGAAPFYRCYQSKSDQFVAIGAIEPKFYRAVCGALALTEPLFDDQMARENWPQMRLKIAQRIAQMDQDQLQKAIDIPDACMSWVVPLREAGKAGHMAERGMLLNDGKAIKLAAAPRFTNAKERMIEQQN